MADTAKTALNHFNEEVRVAAKRLKVVFETYGNLAKKPLNEETSAVYNLVQDLRNTYENEVQLTHLDEWITELEAANNAFEQLGVDRFEEDAAKTHLVMKEVRSQVDALYKTMCDRMNAYALLEGDGSESGTQLFGFILFFNGVIEKYANIIAARYGRHGD
jgi:hypothetical protein